MQKIEVIAIKLNGHPLKIEPGLSDLLSTQGLGERDKELLANYRSDYSRQVLYKNNKLISVIKPKKASMKKGA
ncbi:hypothetical protein ACLIA0_06145 [Bacillaceae bacterium W0354]